MVVSLSDIVSYKRLVAAGNNKLYYEDIDVTAGTMTELAAASGDIDTSDQLVMFEAYQKVFVINGSNLKVADFINTKLTCSALTTPPAKGDILTQDQGSSKYAYMVVDYVNTAKTAIYGYAYYGGGATAFNTANTVSSNDAGATMDPSTFTPTAVTNAPHWYTYTVYPGDASGALPNKAYLGCLYRGRVVLSGDPEHPFQWYMSRLGNPWDYAYVADDTASPVAGGNSDAGELGDIVRCLIPYKDDYLVIGCTSSIWFIAGDPAYGGSLNELDLSTGIYGANSWCFGDKGILYFWGTNGIYATTIPGAPECLTKEVIPGIVADEAVDPSTHRITLAYDRQRNGILVCITKLSDGTNSNYWYSLTTGGFFPETYPEECGPYSLFYYDANDDDYRTLLVGCKDGYIRKFSNDAKSDDIGATDEAIDANVTLGPIALSDGLADGKLTGMNIISSGGGSSGTENDSDDIDYKVYIGRTAADILEDIDAGSNPKFSGTFVAPGLNKSNRERRQTRGRFTAIKLSNDTAGESISLERLVVNANRAGRML